MSSKRPSKAAAFENLVVARNRRARHDYEILDTVEAGIVLRGTEVKTVRAGKASIAEAYARIEGGEVWLIGMNVPEYDDASYNNHAAKRRRKLLMNRGEIRRWEKRVTLQGLTLVPLEVYFGERGFAKVSLALVRGKQEHDKRQAIKQRESKREMARYKR